MRISLSSDTLYNRLSVLSKTLGSGKKNSSSVLNSFLFNINNSSSLAITMPYDNLNSLTNLTTTQSTYILISANEESIINEESILSANEKHNKFRISANMSINVEDLISYWDNNTLNVHQRQEFGTLEYLFNGLIKFESLQEREKFKYALTHSNVENRGNTPRVLDSDEQDFKNTYIRKDVKNEDVLSFLSRLKCCKNYSQLAGILKEYKVTILEQFSITKAFCESLIPLVGFRTTKKAESFRRSLSSHYTEKKTA